MQGLGFRVQGVGVRISGYRLAGAGLKASGPRARNPGHIPLCLMMVSPVGKATPVMWKTDSGKKSKHEVKRTRRA